MHDERSPKQDSTIGAGICTFYPDFRKLLPAILRVMISHGEAYTPDTTSMVSPNGSYTESFDSGNVDEFAIRWKDEDPGRTFWKFEKTKPAGLIFTVGDTIVPYRTLLTIMNREHLVKNHEMKRFLEILRELYILVHPFYGTVWIAEMVRKVNSPLGMVTPGFDLEKGIPDIYWANLWGPEYIEMFGAERVFSAPFHSVERLPDGGAFLLLSPSPFDYASYKPELDKRRLEIMKHLGSQAFLVRDPSSKGEVPKFRYEEEWNANQKQFFETHPINQGILFDVSREQWENWVRNSQAISSSFVSDMEIKGVTLDYSEASLDRLDEYLERSNDSKESPSTELIEKLGAYLTQTMIKHTRAEWWFPEGENLPSLKIDGIIMTPLVRVLKVFEERERLGHWYRTVSKTISNLGTSRLT